MMSQEFLAAKKTQNTLTQSAGLEFEHPSQNKSPDSGFLTPSLQASVDLLSRHILTSTHSGHSAIPPAVIYRLDGLLTERLAVELAQGSSKTVSKLLAGIDEAITATRSMPPSSTAKLNLSMNSTGLIGGSGFGGGSSRNRRVYVPVREQEVRFNLDTLQDRFNLLADVSRALEQQVSMLETLLPLLQEEPEAQAQVRQEIESVKQKRENALERIAIVREKRDTIHRTSTDVIEDFEVYRDVNVNP